jgi:hypothetical protein
MRTGLVIVLSSAGLIVMLLVIWNARFQWKLRKHHGISRASFLAYFVERGVEAKVAAAVYDHYRSYAIWKSFSISPDDEIAVLFNQEGDDTDADLARIVKKLGLEMPSEEAWDARSEPPMKTVDDLIHAVVWAGRNQPKENGVPRSHY